MGNGFMHLMHVHADRCKRACGNGEQERLHKVLGCYPRCEEQVLAVQYHAVWLLLDEFCTAISDVRLDPAGQMSRNSYPDCLSL